MSKLPSKSIPFSPPDISDLEIAEVIDALKSGWITTGPRTKELERRLAKYCGTSKVVCLNSATAAEELNFRICGIEPGDEVIVPAYTYTASASAAIHCGAKVVFIDNQKDSCEMDYDKVADAITEKTKAIVAVDFTGQAVQIDEIREICKRHNLILIEDGAHSIGTKYNGKRVGSLADMTTFSFHPVKTITGGEGGAILTNDEGLYQKLILYRTHGITKNPELFLEQADGPWYYEQIELGYNYRMTDIQAALICSQLDKLSQFVSRRKAIVKMYDEAFREVPEIIVQREIEESDTARHLYIIQLELSKLKVGRAEIFQALRAENVCCNVHYIPVYYFPYYKKHGYSRGLCPNAEKLYEGIISIPLYYSMSDEDVESVIHAVRKVIEYYRK